MKDTQLLPNGQFMWKPSRWFFATVAAANVVTPIIGASSNRWGLRFMATSTTTFVFIDQDDGVTGGSATTTPGIIVNNTCPSILLTEDQDGDIVHKSWAVLTTTVGGVCAWVEIYRPNLYENPRAILQQSVK